jgi:hypothetical protein
MLHPVFAYFGPEVTMPLASIIGAILSVGVMFGRNIMRGFSRVIRVAARKSS